MRSPDLRIGSFYAVVSFGSQFVKVPLSVSQHTTNAKIGSRNAGGAGPLESSPSGFPARLLAPGGSDIVSNVFSLWGPPSPASTGAVLLRYRAFHSGNSLLSVLLSFRDEHPA